MASCLLALGYAAASYQLQLGILSAAEFGAVRNASAGGRSSGSNFTIRPEYCVLPYHQQAAQPQEHQSRLPSNHVPKQARGFVAIDLPERLAGRSIQQVNQL